VSAPRVLVAGIGNVFLGDDGFGVEVVARLDGRPLPDGVQVADYGIRGFDLACALMDGYDAAILVDAVPRGEPPGTLCVLEAELDGPEGRDGSQPVNGHGLNPLEVFRLVRQFGGTPPPTYVVGCEPADLAEMEAGSEGRMGLSPAVAAAVDEAVELVGALVDRITPKEER
jgi:hydrogenase maturation protease